MTIKTSLILAFVPLIFIAALGLRWSRVINVARVGRSPGLFGLGVLGAKHEFAVHGHLLMKKGYQEVEAVSPL